MTTKEIFYYVKLMCLIKNKNKGKADENDVQRALGSLHCPDFRKALLFFVLYFISMLLLIVLCIYFACCELYENKIDKINETEQMRE